MKYSNLIEGQQISNGIGRMWTVILLIRWNIIGLILVFLREDPLFQVSSLIIILLVSQVLILTGKPLNESNKILLFNEFMASVYLYFLIALLEEEDN